FLIHKIICYRFYLYYKVFKNLELDRRDQKNWQITKNWKIYISDILNLEDCVQLEDLKEYKRILEKSKTIVDFKVNINKQYLVK
ncbi:hypothetical protein ACQRC6_05615, partial [Peptoniphilus sp. SGI.035]|uniref:hypothetical protein n=1 Tax=Peptoniphilus sp. SGI.035 TaxID=3420564 RepID=UPI003CFF79BA